MRPSFRLLPVSTVLLGLALLGSGAHAATVQRGVLIDAGNAQVLLMAPGGGIEAVAIADGATRWRSDAADLPVQAREGHVVALRDRAERGVLPFALLDLRDGSAVASRDAALPSPARVLIDERLGERFELEGGDGNAFQWRYVFDTVPGALLAEQHAVADGAEPAASSVPARVHVELTGSATLVPEANRSAVNVDAQPRPAPVARVERQVLPAFAGRQFLSVDERHVLVSQAAEGERWRWRVYDRDGERLGEVETDYSYRPFAVYDGVLLLVSRLHLQRRGEGVQVAPSRLYAIDLTSGVMRWSREVRDTEFRGPYPP